jgi:hypothetical protein
VGYENTYPSICPCKEYIEKDTEVVKGKGRNSKLRNGK